MWTVFEEDPSMRLPLRQGAPVDFAKSGFSFFSLGWLMLMDPGVVGGQTASCPGIHVTILNIRNSIGTVDCALFDSPNGFPGDVLRSAMRLVGRYRTPRLGAILRASLPGPTRWSSFMMRT